MTGERSEDDIPLDDTRSPEEWADQLKSMAAAEGVTPEEAVERLISSYWTLTEIHQRLSESGGDVGLFDRSVDVAGVEDQADETTPTTEAIDELHGRLDDLEEKLRAERETRADMNEDIEVLIGRLDAVDEQLRYRQSSIESRLDEELEYLEDILGYLIDETETLDERVGSMEEALNTVRDGEDHEGLTELKQTASQLGVRSGVCDNCETSVDIGVLPTAECPDCGERFVDIDPATGWFGLGTDTLVTSSRE